VILEVIGHESYKMEEESKKKVSLICLSTRNTTNSRGYIGYVALYLKSNQKKRERGRDRKGKKERKREKERERKREREKEKEREREKERIEER
jgi:hypothetical protein